MATISPTLNINGTSAADLIEPRLAAYRTLQATIEVLQEVTPHGRDYPGEDDRCAADRSAHFDRILTLSAIKEQIYAEAVAIHRSSTGDAA